MYHNPERRFMRPHPGIINLRDWDRLLLERYPPAYHPVNTSCAWCALGPCDLLQGRVGACGQSLRTLAAREALLLGLNGACAHAAHARDLLEYLINHFGAHLSLHLGPLVKIRAPLIQLITGTRPSRLGDLLGVLDYVETQLVRLEAAAHFGGESDPIDLESKTFHAGTMDLLALEVADLAQTAAYHLPTGSPHTPLVALGPGQIDRSKPVILCIGHHSAVGHLIAELLKERGLEDGIELVGLCCTAHDLARAHGSAVKIVGNQRDQLSFIRAGVADIVVVDQQCVRLDLKDEALATGACFIATSDQACAGLPDETYMDPEVLACDLAERAVAGTLVTDVTKAAKLAVALANRGKRSIFGHLFAGEQHALGCTRCGICEEHCPAELPLTEAVAALSWEGRWDILSGFTDRCLRCGRCDVACPFEIPVMALIETVAADSAVPKESAVRAGRGAISELEIKLTGPSIILGDIPGIVAFLACPDYPDGRDAVSWMASILANRGYIVLAAGCAAMDLALRSSIYGPVEKGRDGEAMMNPYEQFPPVFDQGGIVNTGSCVSASHAIGAAIKIASIFLHRQLSGNLVDIADYILNRVGMVGVLWGGVTPKALAVASGANRLGIPVLFGPRGERFRRTLESRPDGPWWVLDARTGSKLQGAPAPSALCTTAHTREEALVTIARLCLRPNDTTIGRQVKLANYAGLARELLGHVPEDLARWIRSPYDIPEEWNIEEREKLISQAPDPVHIPDPTILEELVRGL